MDFTTQFRNDVKILVVDGDLESLSTILHILHTSGYQVVQATQANDSLDILHCKYKEIDFILADVNLPDMNRINFMSSAKKISNVPIIFMSAHNDKDLMLECLFKGALLYLIKPIKFSDVRYLWQYVARMKKWVKLSSLKDKGEGLIRANNKSVVNKWVGPSSFWEKQGSSSRINNNFVANNSDDNNLNATKKLRLWTPELHDKFVLAYDYLGSKEANPKKILELMKVPKLTPMQVASHLQKHRRNLKPSGIVNGIKTTRKNIPSSSPLPQTDNFTTHVGLPELATPIQNSQTHNNSTNPIDNNVSPNTDQTYQSNFDNLNGMDAFNSEVSENNMKVDSGTYMPTSSNVIIQDAEQTMIQQKEPRPVDLESTFEEINMEDLGQICAKCNDFTSQIFDIVTTEKRFWAKVPLEVLDVGLQDPFDVCQVLGV
ncbi:hypothetical protein ACFE04_026472 [Oxalis oulophora]